MRSWSGCGYGRGGCAARGVSSRPGPGTTPGRSPRPGGTWTWGPGGCGSGPTCAGCAARCTGVITQGVPFARPGSRFTRDFEDLVGWLATTMDKTALRRVVRVDWDTVGRIIERVMADGLDPERLDGLF